MLKPLKTDQWWGYHYMVMLGSAYFAIYTTPSLPPVSESLARLVIFTLATIGIASFGYVLNDLTDIRQDLRSGHYNIMGRHDRLGQLLILAFVVLLGIIPWAWLPRSPLILALLVLEYGLFLAYSVPPVRLKTRGLLGPIADSLYAYVIPGIIAALVGVGGKSSPALMLYIIAFAIWAFLFGLLGILRHQLFDYSRDQLCGVKTFIVKHGWDNGFDATLKLSRVVLAATLFLVFLEGAANLFIVLCFGVHLTWQLWHRKKRALDARAPTAHKPESRTNSFHLIYDRIIGEFCWYWQPLAMLTLIALRSPEYLTLLLIHVLLLPNGIRRMATWRARG